MGRSRTATVTPSSSPMRGSPAPISWPLGRRDGAACSGPWTASPWRISARRSSSGPSRTRRCRPSTVGSPTRPIMSGRSCCLRNILRQRTGRRFPFLVESPANLRNRCTAKRSASGLLACGGCFAGPAYLWAGKTKQSRQHKHDLEIDMFTSKNTFAAAALSLLTIGTANAQTPTFGVQAMAATSGYSGTYTDNPGAVSGGQSAGATSDPAGLQFNNGYGLVYGDAAANATAYTHYLYGSAYALADRITATAFANSSPTANTESRWWDYITVRSNTLPNGTVVELVFRNALTTNWTASGVYKGNVYSDLQVGSYSASTQSRMDSTWG